jgi:hypothetical protein
MITKFFLKLCYHYRPMLFRNRSEIQVHGSTSKEDDPAVNFEVGLVLSDFFLNYGLQQHNPHAFGRNIYEVMINSITH